MTKRENKALAAPTFTSPKMAKKEQASFPNIMLRLIQVFLALALIGVPILINPLGFDPFESTKMLFFRLLCGGLIVIIGLTTLSTNQLNPILDQISHTWKTVPVELRYPIMSLGAIVALSILLSINRSGSILGTSSSLINLTSLLCWLLFIWAVLVFLARGADRFRPVQLAIVASIPVAIYGLIQYFQLDPIIWETDSVSPILSTLGRSIYLGEYLAVLFVITLTFAIYSPENRSRIAVILILQLVCFLLTIARGAWLGLMGGLVALLLAEIRFRISWRTIGAIGLFLSVTLIGFFVIQSGGGILESLGNNAYLLFNQRAGSNQVRLSIWLDSVTLITASPFRFLFGYGLNMFETAYYTVLTSETRIFRDNYRVTDPHNFLLKIWVELGLVGVICFVWFIVRYYQLLIIKLVQDQANRTDRYLMIAALCGVTGILIPKLFNPIVSVHLLLYMLFIGIGISLLSKQTA